jgi:hypothetical protein
VSDKAQIYYCTVCRMNSFGGECRNVLCALNMPVETARLRLAALPGVEWRHVGRGLVYEVLCVGTGQGGSIEDKPVVVYVRKGRVSVREESEFFARFEPVVPA